MRRIFFVLGITCTFFAAAQSSTADLIKRLSGTMADTARVNLLNKIANRLDDVRDTTEVRYAKQALTLAQQINYTYGEATAHLMLGFAEENHSNFPGAIQQHQKALALYESIGEKTGQAKALGNMANNEYHLGDYSAAAGHALKSLRLYEEVHYPSGIYGMSLALGNIFLQQKNFDGARQEYRRALDVSRASFTKDQLYEARALANLGNVFSMKQEYDSAAFYYVHADTVFERQMPRSSYEVAVCSNNLGSVRQAQKLFSEADFLYRRSLRLRRIMGDSAGVASVYDNLGGLANDQGKTDSSLYYYRSALQLAYINQSKSQRLTCYEGLAETFANPKLARFDSAYYYLDRARTLADTVNGEESVNVVNQLKARYDAEKQQHAIDLLESQRLTDKANSARNVALLSIGILALLAITGVMVYRYRVKQRAADTLERKNLEITLQKKEITDSINYAKRIQESILPPDHTVRKLLPTSFIFYEPKDIVSGDFYWIEELDGKIIFAAVDCTGHGVPGALMSVVGFNLLNQAVNERHLTKPSDILQHLDYGVNKLLRQSDADNTVKDGMDLALCTLDLNTRIIQYAGVFNPLYIIHKGELREIKADKFPIGLNVDGKVDDYTNHTIQLEAGDMIYIFSDGYADQFGGPTGKKYKYNQLRQFLLSVHMHSPEEQRRLISEQFHSWKGRYEQIDDVLVIGVKL
jgi:serine phosphatase RsbU (regulator of sigma subunit)